MIIHQARLKWQKLLRRYTGCSNLDCICPTPRKVIARVCKISLMVEIVQHRGGSKRRLIAHYGSEWLVILRCSHIILYMYFIFYLYILYSLWMCFLKFRRLSFYKGPSNRLGINGVHDTRPAFHLEWTLTHYDVELCHLWARGAITGSRFNVVH